MLTIAEAITISAKERKESRGGHFREDFTEKSEAFANVNHCLRKKENGSMEISRIPKLKLRDDLQQIVEENK
jgi:succinate dehydrogenase / fumarate reductase flavoprotein subunit